MTDEQQPFSSTCRFQFFANGTRESDLENRIFIGNENKIDMAPSEISEKQTELQSTMVEA